MTTVGTILTCYNEGAYIEAAVRSVLTQTRADAIDKIVILDDGSSQETLDVLKTIQTWDPRIEIIFERGNGLPKARNIASEKVKSDWIAILDGDDIWLPGKIEKQLLAIAGRPKLGLVYTGVYMFPDGAPEERAVAKINDLGQSRNLERDYFLRDGPIIPSSIMVERRVFERVGKFDATIKVFEDTEFYSRMAAACEFAMVREPLVEKRVHGASITSRRKQLMAHHANVAFLIAGRQPALIRHVPKRLAERARKLGNVEIAEGNKAAAAEYYRMAVALTPFSWKARLSLWALQTGLPLGRLRNVAISRRN
jgi:glycosyltransferase involved in cell wall biosynthesis